MPDWLRNFFSQGDKEAEVYKLICGLGNPGPRYSLTRHNAGFWLVDKFAGSGCWMTYQDLAEVCFMGLNGKRVILLKPLTFMNLSGRAVSFFASKMKLKPANILVAYDDLDLPLGALRLRPGGGSGGHRGLQSVIDALGTKEFPRLRLGIGRPPAGVETVDYVLSVFAKNEKEIMEGVLEDGVAALKLWIDEGIDAAMNRYNRSKAPG